ncbi:MAG: MFS transporter [Ktedonobacteraceae bacterium]
MSIHPLPPRTENDSSVETSASAANEQRAAKLFSFGSIFLPLRNRNFSLLFSGQLISNIGDGLYYVALPWFMLSGGGGVQALGIVLGAFGVARVVGALLGGPLTNMLRPRRVMLMADSVRVVLMAALTLLVLAGHPALWVLCLLSALLGLFGGMFLPASMSVAPSILHEDELQAGNSLTSSSAQLASAAGLGIAGVVVAWLKPAGTLGLDAATFLISAGALFFMRDMLSAKSANAATSEGNAGTKSETMVPPLTFGQLLRRSHILQTILLLFVCVSLGTGAMFEVALPVLLHDQLHASASGYGFILAGFSVGAIIGSLAAGGLGKIPYRLGLSMVCFLIEAALLILLPLMGNVTIGVLIMLVAGVLNGLIVVTAMAILQGQIPTHLLGSVMGLLAVANFGLYPISVGIAGVLVPRFGSVPVFLAGGLLLALPALVGCLQPNFWQRGDVKLMGQK